MMDVPQGRFDVPDCIFPTNNALKIPLLDIKKQGHFAATPFMPWGSRARNQRMPGIYHGYTEDYRCEALWRDPTPVLRSDCLAAVEPNFTTSEQMPPAVAYFQIYRKRWIARYWQEYDLPVFVDLNVAPAFYLENLLGVPYGWRAYCTRGYSERLEYLDVEYALACERRGDTDVQFIVYGGGIEVVKHCEVKHYLHLPEAMDIRKGKVIDG